MHIKEIVNQHRRDFTAVYKCEHCGNETKGSGYDDDYFHNVVVPSKKCEKCGEKAKDNSMAMTPKYAAHEVV